MEGKELYEEGLSHLSETLDNTQFTHVHSEDIRANVIEHYFILAAKLEYLPAIKAVCDYYGARKDMKECVYWIKQYKRIAKCSNKELAEVFGMKMMIRLIF